jgi:hypothetical protein
MAFAISSLLALAISCHPLSSATQLLNATSRRLLSMSSVGSLWFCRMQVCVAGQVRRWARASAPVQLARAAVLAEAADHEGEGPAAAAQDV